MADIQGGIIMSGHIKVFTLDDGSTITNAQLQIITGLAQGTCSKRLARSKNREVLTRPVDPLLRKRPLKKYTLSDGSIWTMPEMVAHTGSIPATLSARIFKNKSAKEVLAPHRVIRPSSDDRALKKEVAERMFFDPDGFWKIFNGIGKLST
jgi:hypothetical protein